MGRLIFILIILLQHSFAVDPWQNKYINFISSSVVYENKVYPYYILYNRSGQIEGIFIESKDWVKDVKGYGGTINLQIIYTVEGRIKEINVIEHYETESYAREVFSKKFLSQYLNKNSQSKFILGEDVQGVTGATISCSAVNEIIYRCTKLVSLSIFKKGILDRKSSISLKKDFPVLILISIFIFAIIGYLLNITPVRYIVMFISIILLGIFYAGGLSIGHIRNIVYVNFPVFWDNIFFWILLSFTLITTVLFGRLYCGWLCPFGAVIEILFNIKHYFEKKYKSSLGKEIDLTVVEDNKIIKFLRRLEHYFRQIKYILFIVILVLPGVIWIEPFQDMFTLYKLKFQNGIYLGVIIIFCIIFIRLWCRYVCPLGGVLGLGSLLAVSRLKINNKNCLQCSICKNICPTNAIVEKDGKYKIVFRECILCNKCRTYCGPKSINITFL